MNPDVLIREIAERQAGVVSNHQLRSAGLSFEQIHIRRKRGDLIDLLPSVVRLAGAPDSYVARLQAVARWIDDKGFFSGATAAHLMKLDGIDRPEKISIAYPGVRRSPSWVKLHRIDEEDNPPTRRLNGFRVSFVERTLLDCAGEVPPRRLGLALDDALRKRLTTLDRMWMFLESVGRGRRGKRLLRELLMGRDDRDEKVRSRFETRMLRILRRLEGLCFVPDHEVSVDGAKYYLDFYCEAAALGIECHSFRWHMGRHVADMRRDRHIRRLGIELVYFSWDDVAFSPRDVEDEIRSVAARRLGTSQQRLVLEGSLLKTRR